MGTLKREYRTNVDASPNQLVAVADASRPIAFVGYTVDNTDNTEGVWAHFYNATSGTVNDGTATDHIDPQFVSAESQVKYGTFDEHDPLQNFDVAVTVRVTTTRDGTTSPTNDVPIGITYYTY